MKIRVWHAGMMLGTLPILTVVLVETFEMSFVVVFVTMMIAFLFELFAFLSEASASDVLFEFDG